MSEREERIAADPIAKLIWDWGSQTIETLDESESDWLTTPNEIRIARFLRAHGVADPIVWHCTRCDSACERHRPASLSAGDTTP